MDTQLRTVLKAFLAKFTSCEAKYIFAGRLADGTPMPKASFIIMRHITGERFGKSWSEYGNNSETIVQPKQVRYQLDFYGALAAEWGRIIEAIWNHRVGCDFLRPCGLAPLYSQPLETDDYVAAEKRHEGHARLDVLLEIKSKVTLPQDFIEDMTIGIEKI